jgi:hypothetical protein
LTIRIGRRAGGFLSDYGFNVGVARVKKRSYVAADARRRRFSFPERKRRNRQYFLKRRSALIEKEKKIVQSVWNCFKKAIP